MPMNTEERKQVAAIAERVSTLEKVDQARPADAQSKQPSQSDSWLKTHKWTLGRWSLLVAVLAFAYVPLQDYFELKVDRRIDGKLSPINTKLDEINSKVTSVAASLETLKPLITDLIQQQMKKTAALSQGDFRNSLPTVAHLLAAAHQERVTVEPRIIGAIQQKLVATPPDSNQFWLVSANFLNYRSFNDVPLLHLNADGSIPDCADSAPEAMRITQVPTPNTFKFNTGTYRNCRFTLDSAKDNQRVNYFLQNGFPLITFENCLIVYRGGEIRLIVAWNKAKKAFVIEGHAPIPVEMTGATLEFENCLLDFRFSTVPPPQGQRTTKILLAQNTSPLKLPVTDERSQQQ